MYSLFGALNDDKPYLLLSSSIDAELATHYTLELKAFSPNNFDSGSCLTLEVNIVDINDNSPEFIQALYTARVSEDISVDSIIAKVSGVDNDVTEINNVIAYKLEEANDYFNMDEQTGELYLTQRLDYEQTSSYNLVIISHDSGSPQLSSSTLIHVIVTNVNDHAPEITVTNIQEQAQVIEHSAVGTFVSHISITDIDQDSVICSVNTTEFQLQPIYENEYTMVVNVDIDREFSDIIYVLIKCTDNGQPSKSSQIVFNVMVLDINDNSPQFELPIHHVYHLLENQPAGSFLIKLYAQDPDMGDNSKITFTLSDEMSQLFNINSETGEIQTASSLDYEEESSIIFTVKASDHGSPSQTSSTLVHVHLVDVNDNKPTFTQSSYQFSLPEEDNAVITIVGMIRATDRDQNGEQGVWYRIIDTYNIFSISYTGIITTENSLDREITDRYQVIVVATDFGEPALSSEVDVQITVIDINDNSPTFTLDSNTTYTVYDYIQPEQTIALLIADDLDSSDHGKLSYEIYEGSDTFSINSSSGRLHVTRPLSNADCGAYPLRVSVTDQAGHSDMLSLTIVVVDGIPPSTHESKVNLSGIIIGVLSSLMFIIILLAVISFIRIKRQKRLNNRYNCRKAAECRINSSQNSSRNCAASYNVSPFSEQRADQIRGSSLCCSAPPNQLSTPTYVRHNLTRSFSVQTNQSDSGCGSMDSPPGLPNHITLTPQPTNQITECFPRLNETITIARPSLVAYSMEDGISTLSKTLSHADDSDVFNVDYSMEEQRELDIHNCAICLDDSVTSWSHTHDVIDQTHDSLV